MDITIGNFVVPVYSHKVIVIGTGCAGYNAADCLDALGVKDVAIVSDNILGGTSRNAGSDKQTYYKLSLAAGAADSVQSMASDLFAGGSMNGDTALIEAAYSASNFSKLASLGVPFPRNKYGEFTGYRTDHDLRERATSAGPLTSKIMTEVLESSVNSKKIRIYNRTTVIKLLVKDNRIFGFLANVVTGRGYGNDHLCLFIAGLVIMATGGPASVYSTTVYPASQTGATGLAIREGADCCNMNEWQYGLASTEFKWNVSGSYQQVLPRYVSVDSSGTEHEFLNDYFNNPSTLLEMIFLKGYQWPFDSAKIEGSSVIDILVHREIAEKGNRVFLDFRSNPSLIANDFTALPDLPRNFLDGLDALAGTPYDRLSLINPDAIAIYRDNGIDLRKKMLEIAVCAQHCNGGLDVDLDWQTSIKGLYAIGEAAGTFGVYRPGGSALNSTQTGSVRAAEHIAYVALRSPSLPSPEQLKTVCSQEALRFLDEIKSLTQSSSNLYVFQFENTLSKLKSKMSSDGAHVRSMPGLRKLDKMLMNSLAQYDPSVYKTSIRTLTSYMNTVSTIITQRAMVSAMIVAAKHAGSRGGAMVIDRSAPGGIVPEDVRQRKYQFITTLREGKFKTATREIRPIPTRNDKFETVWREYRSYTHIV